MDASGDRVEDVVALDGVDLTILRPRDSGTLLDEQAFGQEEYLPYWADLWPSAELLARTIAGRSLRGAPVVELGCGLGLPSLVAALAGGRVLATDWSPDAIAAVRANAERNGLRVEAAVAAWQEPGALLARGPFSLVLAADVLYERRNAGLLGELLPRLVGPGGEVWLADPGRAPAEQLLADLEHGGWARGELAVSDRPRVTVHRLRPPVDAEQLGRRTGFLPQVAG